MASTDFLKTLQDANDLQIKIAKQVIAETGKLTQLNKENAQLRNMVNKLLFKDNEAKRKLTHLGELIPRQKESIANVTKEIKKLHLAIDKVVHDQARAKMVSASEQLRRQKFHCIMNEYIEQWNLKETEHMNENDDKLKKISAEEISKKTQEMVERKEYLTQRVQYFKEKRPEMMEQVSEKENEMLILQNRNRAILLRMRNQLKKAQEQKVELADRLKSLLQVSARKAREITLAELNLE